MRETAKVQGFKPLVATSLALTLGVSVASAYDLTGLTNTSGGSNIEISNVASDSNNLTLTTSDNYSTFSNTNGSTPTDFRIWVGAQNNDITAGQAKYKITNATLNVLQINNTDTTFESTTSGLKMGNGTGTLKFSYSGASGRNFNLNLSNTTSTNYALYGNLEIENFDATGASTFNGTFGAKGIKGNVTFNGGSNITSTLNFSDGANIEGNVSAIRGANILSFAGTSTITGTVTTSQDNTVSTTLSLSDGANVAINGGNHFRNKLHYKHQLCFSFS